MNRGKGSLMRRRMGGQYGYTIVEVLIFLAVSALLFVSTMGLLSGRQARAQFTNAIRDFETKLQDVSNDVANGYYQSSDNVTCAKGNPPVVTAGSSAGQGTHQDCVVLGRVVKFGYDGATGTEQYGIYTLVGNRLNDATKKDVASLAEAAPTLLWTTNSATNEQLRERLDIGYGTRVRCVNIGASCNPASTSNGALAFITNLGGGATVGRAGGALVSRAYVYSQPTAAIGVAENIFANAGTSVFGSPTPVLDNQTLTICIQSATNNQYALVRIANGRFTSEVKSGGATCS